MNEIRTERTFGVTAELKPRQRQHLQNLMESEVYTDLLDVLEMVCIETETTLINTDPAKPEEVLANHHMAKSAWQMFTHMQEKIAHEANVYVRSLERKPPVPALSPTEKLIANILDPTQPAPEEEEFYGLRTSQ